MFFRKDDVKLKIRNIIIDDADNDIAFVISSKGVGKLSLLAEIYDIESHNHSIIIADGKRIRGSSSCLCKCFIDGIYSYIEKHNSPKIREKFLRLLPKGKVTVTEKISFVGNAFISRRKIKIPEFASYLFDLTPKQLKDVYVGLAGATPLVLFASAIWLDSTDIEYLQNLYSDNWEAKITFIIALRPTVETLNAMNQIIAKKRSGVWVFPLMPTVVVPADATFPEAFATISVKSIGTSERYYDFYHALRATNDYIEMYNIVNSLLSDTMHPVNLCFMANQEISNQTYDDLLKIVSTIYPTQKKEFDNRVVLPYDGRLLWIDALSYYITLHEGISEAIIATQRFFFDIIIYSRRFEKGSPKRAKFTSFLSKAKKSNTNELASGFATYFSSFASFASVFSSKEQFGRNTSKNALFAVELLDRAVLEFSDSNIDSSISFLNDLYEDSQLCAILDICLETITRFFERIEPTFNLEHTTIRCISKFQTVCMTAAYQWLDLTILNKIVALQKKIISSGRTIKFEFKQLTTSEEKTTLFEYLKKELNKENLRMRDILMRATIFLSYTHTDNAIADIIETELTGLGYEVKRDIRNIEPWDNLQQFMKSIRKQDYAIFLVSDKYLHQVNCMYEIMQFMKDENFGTRSFPIAIGFTKAELLERNSQGKTTSMFEDLYWIENVKYWQDYAQKMRNQLSELERENSGELDLRYRDINELSQTVAKFYGDSFGPKLLATIDPENANVEDIVKRIDKKISSDLAASEEG